MAAMLLDTVLVLFLLLQTWLGTRSGLLRQAAGTISLVAGVLLGLAAAPFLGRHLMSHVTSNPFHARLAAFVLTAGVVGLVLRLLCAWTEARAEAGLSEEERERRRSRDHLWGGVFGAGKGVVSALLLTATAAAWWPEPAFWQETRLAQRLARGGACLLPEGAEKRMRAWVNSSAEELRRGLNIRVSGGEHPATASAARPEPQKDDASSSTGP